MKKLPFWLKFGLASALIVYISAVFFVYLFYRAFGSDLGELFTNLPNIFLEPFDDQYIFTISLIAVFLLGSLIGKIFNVSRREHIKKVFDKYRNSLYLPFLIFIVFQVFLVVFIVVFNWVVRTEEIWNFIGLDESSDSIFTSIFYMSFSYALTLFYLLSKLFLVGVLYSGIYQIKNGLKKEGVINIALFILAVLLGGLLF